MTNEITIGILGTSATTTTSTTSTPPLTLLDRRILNEKLYNDLAKFCQEDKIITPDIFISNFAFISSFFATNRILLRVGKNRPTDVNTFIALVGNSGKGKTYINDFFQDTVNNIQAEESSRNKEINDFVKACKAYNYSNTDLTDEQKDGYVKGYNRTHLTNFDAFNTKELTPHIFTTNDFTPEALADRFKSSRNGTIMLNANEFQELKNNIGRTKTVDDIFSFMIPFFEGKSGLAIRKSQDDSMMNNAKLCVLFNTPIDTFEELKQTKFFPSGNGYRYFFCINNQVDLDDPHLPEKSNDCVSYYQKYQGEFAPIIRTFFYGMVYMSTQGCQTFKINQDDTLQTYNECLLNLWRDYVKNNEWLRDIQKETLRARLGTMLNKCILIVYLMNYAYDHINSKGSIYPFQNLELSVDDVLKGYNFYLFFLPQMINIFSTELKSDLTATEIKIIEVLEIGKSYDKDVVLKMLEEKPEIGSKETFYRMLRKKSNQFTVTIDRIRRKQQIIRNF